MSQDVSTPVNGDAVLAQLHQAKRLIHRLRQRSQQMQTILELSGYGVAYFSPSGQLLQSNLEIRRLMAWPIQGPGEIGLLDMERQLHGLLVEADVPKLKLLDWCDTIQDSQKAQSIRVETRQGKILAIHMRATVEDEHVVYIQDVTQDTHIDRMKSEFLTIAAHELRTPLASIFGFSEILAHRPLSPERTADLAISIHRQAKWMVSMLNELLDLARIEARKDLDLLAAPHLLADLVQSAMEDFCDASDLGRVSVAPNLPPAAMMVDFYKAKQALGHVIANALKYSPGGESVHIRFEAADRQAVPGMWIEVQDHGIGMSPAQLARLFERFWRGDPSCNIPGSGLGMSLAEKIVQMHGGQILVTSALSEGTCVRLWLPTATSAK